ncbi:MAG: hypothetical protein COW00_00085 [Bdellovibrio sp. CG12_big_fil_rev_8_21_14_0_65_39_13]|nr:MAG: hypothetical protein COW78_20010 [Bdellovibrio sp. CG22_combo_CG10-13_8_21_14_all_39_27]PIQ62881.1 MAG: hypothetical protein COW00_00085 [Bdellovibrio sp. CG12_big_fil_rev_8_21_14_0_65_39_13]PIR33236.1 MAG: hypothetical protein COV37_16820 [Bdellovibrio sp. CG11_big_fil_rev_8_21_14_0_20_39_38]PJB54014.1 MAG: hypothetical protein CO099_03950 [Bdellovibrio sp. CG_4_9_14_3_um_filter_39_7]
MNKATFPTLLKSRATILGNFTRFDLVILGGSYLILSWMKVSGILSLAINAFLYFILKLIENKFPKGFFLGLRGKQMLIWSYKLGHLHE